MEETAATAAEPVAAPKPTSVDIARRVNEMKRDASAPAPAAEASEEQASAEEQAPVAPEQSADEQPQEAEKPAAPTTRDETKLRQALEKLAAAEGATLEHKASAEKAAARIAELEAKLKGFDEARSDVNKLLQYGRVTPQQLGEMFMKGELKFQPEPEPPKFDIPEEFKADIEYARQRRLEDARRAEQEKAQREWQAGVDALREEFEPLASKYPMLQALPGAVERLYEARSADPDSDLESVLTRANDAVVRELEGLVAHEATKKWLTQKLGVEAKAPAPKGPPSTLTAKTTAAVPSHARKSGSSSAELAERIRAMKLGV